MNEDDIQFTVTLPLKRSYFNSSEIVETPKKVKKKESNKINNDEVKIGKTSKEKPILLIVEDDTDIRLFTKSILDNEYKIIEAVNGEQGIKKAYQYIPDIIISDVMMPKVDGVQLCNALKQNEKTSHIPIILLAAKSSDKSEIDGLKTGADAYITKPFNSKKLKLQIRNFIILRKELQKRYTNTFNLKDSVTSTPDNQFLIKLKKVLEADLSTSTFNAEQLSDKMLMSRMQLHRKLKALTGLTASEFIKIERLKHSKKVLQETNLTTSQIAYEVGFNSPSYFTKCFKEIYKSTPVQFKNSL